MHVTARPPRARLSLTVALSILLTSSGAARAHAGGEPDPAPAPAPAPAEAAPPPAAESADVAKTACLSSYEQAQVARRERRLLDARAALRACSAAVCPAAVRADCVDWLDQVARSLPSFVVTARALGADVLDVKVTIDGKLAAERLSGFAFELDPGLHKFRFESPPWPAAEREVLASEGVKERPIDVEFAPPPVLATQSAPGADNSRPFRLDRSDYVFGGIAAAGFGTLAYFGGTGLYDAHHLKTTCGSHCGHQDVEAIRTKLLIADIGLAVGIIALALGLYLHGKRAF